jgi:hypothetical protein
VAVDSLLAFGGGFDNQEELAFMVPIRLPYGYHTALEMGIQIAI